MNRTYFNKSNNRNNFNTVVKFRNNEKDIVLKRPKCVLSKENCHEYDRSLVYSKEFWHQIIVSKNGCKKNEVESALSKAVNDKLFIPVGYKIGIKEDTFYIYNQGHALEELLIKNLELMKVNLTFNLGIANYERGHIEPLNKVKDALESRIKEMKNYKLDLSNFKTCEEFFDIKFWMGNKENFTMVCDAFLEVLSRECYQTAMSKITHIDLSNNGLKSLMSLEKFKDFIGVESIDLKDNKIEDFNELQYLKNFRLKKLALLENPVASDQENVYKILAKTLPHLIHCDIPRVLLQTVLENFSTRKIENIPSDEGGNVVIVSDINCDFKEKFQTQQCVGNSWSKVFIEHKGKFEREKILNEIFHQFFMQTPCYPCYYREGEREDSFYLYKNFDAIKILVKNNLHLKIDDEVIDLRLHLRCADYQAGQVKFYEYLPKIITSRIKEQKFDLKNLQKDPRLKNLIINMSTINGLQFVIDWMCKIVDKNKIIEIDLSGNGIRFLDILKDLSKFHNLKVLNLSNNEIDSLIGFPKNLKIVVLSLDNNPLCAKYFYDPNRYVSVFLQLCEKLEYLDGHKIASDLKIVTLKNYYCHTNAYNTVENFVEFFIKNLDDFKRHRLEKIYAHDAIYTERYGKKIVKLLMGKSNIMSHIMLIPPLRHDLINTSIDVPFFNHRQIQIVINGILEINKQLFTYTRNILLAGGNRVIGTLSNTFYFYITNEIFQFDDVRDDKIRNRAFKSIPASLEEIKMAYEGLFTPEQEMNAKIMLFQQITKLKIGWCRRFMEDANGNVSDALEFFANFYKNKVLKQDDFEGLNN